MEFIHTHLSLLGIALLFLKRGECAVSWSEANVEAEQGDDVSVTCRAHLGAIDVMRIFLLTDDGESLAIADNHLLKAQFTQTKRYSVEYIYDADNAAGELILHYKGIRGEDAGQIGCYVLGEQSGQAYVSIEVEVPIEELYIAAIDHSGAEYKMPSGEHVRLREGSNLGVACVAKVNGTQEPAHITIRIAGQDVTGEFKERVLQHEADANQKGLPFQVNTKRLTYQTEYPSALFNNRDLECVARLHGSEKSTTVQLQVEYAPEITCERYEYYQKTGKSITISCDLLANPSPSLEQWYFTQETDANRIEQHPAYSDIQVQSEPVSPDHSKITLKFTNLESSHFTTYILKVENNMAEGRVSIVLHEGVMETETEPIPEVITKPTTTTTESVKYQVVSNEPKDEQDKTQVTVTGTHSQHSTQGSSATRVDILVLFLSLLLYLLVPSNAS